MDPGVNTGAARSRGAAIRLTTRITAGAVCSVSSPAANEDIACGSGLVRRTIGRPPSASSTGETAKMSTETNPEVRKSVVTFSCAAS